MGTPELISPNGVRQIVGLRREALYDTATTRELELQASANLPAHTLMARAGLAVARLARAIQPHARCIWVACGPGNNGGDGLVAATHLHRWALAGGSACHVVVTHAARRDDRVPVDAQWAMKAARDANVTFSDEPPADFDLAIDALLGIGPVRPLIGSMAQWLVNMRTSSAPVLSVDLPSGLDADTGVRQPLGNESTGTPGPRHTLSLLTLKPGLFTGLGRDAAGEVWLDDLGISSAKFARPSAWLSGQACDNACGPATRPHSSHKGSYGDVIAIGGQGIGVDGAGMTGAAVLAARAALHAGAGRVFVGLLEGDTHNTVGWDPACPELMFRHINRLLEPNALSNASVVCGCGGGAAVAAVLPAVLAHASALVLDADALNAVATDPTLQTLLSKRVGQGLSTVLTPHPLEAARLLGSTTAAVMADRVQAAQAIALRFGAVCVLKGSGTVLAAPGETPHINPSGNAALATAGTGDVLAGMIGGALAGRRASPSKTAFERASEAVYQHGMLADRWTFDGSRSLTASRLAARVMPLD
ncbi:NAD(P)H-hydrate dehydratase [Hydrogenophaga sp.]|uniref:NAD(P)H-hydrate dehydratase n=1 Tax=Hydrogenophaga sp. TaxID=1904254 RepID=UPI00271D64C6|nr:NAD(P)H-hydrate dehydratase [Hydrogenophaga sp.]MDO9434149.1 NAD(P)H-hydrate dehydratase [Hydrogenophaga sp.]